MAVNSKRLLLHRLALARFVRENAQSDLQVASSSRPDGGSQVPRDPSISHSSWEGEALRTNAGGRCEGRGACDETPKEGLERVPDGSVGRSAP